MKKILCVTHSDRPFFNARSTITGINRRFSSNRLADLPPIETLQSLDDAMPYKGSLSLWAVDPDKGHRLSKLWDYHPDHKIQSAVLHQDMLLVYSTDRLEIFGTDLKLKKTVRAKGMVGGHTVHCDDEGKAWVTSAPSNAVFRIDLETGDILERLDMPESYGMGYETEEDHDPQAHYIPTAFQPTHVNSAVPAKGGLLVTTWIQGAVGFFDQDRKYREIARGFTGCHGARLDPETGHVFLADSPTGLVWSLDFNTGMIAHRFETGSKWLHDADKLENGIYACTLGDTNELVLVHGPSGEVLTREDCSHLGASTMFVNACEPAPAWDECLQRLSQDARAPSDVRTPPRGEVIAALPDILNCWFNSDQHVALHLATNAPAGNDYLFRSHPVRLKPGAYVLQANATIATGALTLGIVGVDQQEWIASTTLDRALPSGRAAWALEEDTTCNIVVAASNAEYNEQVSALIQSMEIAIDTAPGSAGGSPFGDLITINHEEFNHLHWSINDKLHSIAVLEEKVDIATAERDHAKYERDHATRERDHIAEERDHAIEVRDLALKERDFIHSEWKRMARTHKTVQERYQDIHSKFHSAKELFTQLVAVLRKKV